MECGLAMVTRWEIIARHKTLGGPVSHPVPAPPSNPSSQGCRARIQWVYDSITGLSEQCKIQCCGHHYHTAGVGIVYHHDPDVEDPAVARKQPKQQKFSKAMMMTSFASMWISGRYVATGRQSHREIRKKAVHFVSGMLLPAACAATAGCPQRAVICVAFSSGGQDRERRTDDNHSVALWHSRSGDWKDGKLVSVAQETFHDPLCLLSHERKFRPRAVSATSASGRARVTR